MKQTHWQTIEQIFNEAVALPPDERASFVAEKSGDDEELRREILALLAEDAENTDFLNEPIFSDGLRLLENDFSELLKAGKFARYKLLKLLGRGGMGAVFLAQDTTLERNIALKVLPPKFAENEQSILRFRQEARTASAISHPNVAHIYEFGEEGERYFLAMEYVKGKTLRELLKEKSIDVSHALEIASQIADALVATHKRGIVHRDIKPENIIVTESGLVKVLDFGVAKLNTPTDETSLASLETTPGMIIGTTAYMSPEQVRGLALDARSDLWSFGVLLFEMLAGERPFTGATPSDIQAAILLKDAPVLMLPTKIALVVSKLLKKNLDERYQSIEEVLPDLQRLKNDSNERENSLDVSSFKSDLPEVDILPSKSRVRLLKFLLPVAVAIIAAFSAIYFFGNLPFFQPSDASVNPTKNIPNTHIESLAVLPFQTDGANEELKLLSEGLAEDLTRGLGSLGTVRVISYASARQLRDTENLAEIKARLDVKTLLRGRIEERNNEISVQFELVNLNDGTIIWSEKLNAATNDLLKLRNALTQVIANEFQKINGGNQLILTDYGTRRDDAFRAYLEGKYGADRSNSEGTQRSMKSLERAVALDSQYALAQSALADSYNLLGTWFEIKPDYYQPLAEKTLEKALAIDNNLAEAHTTLAKIKMDFHHDWAGTEREFLKAIEINPNNELAHHWYGEVFLSAMGRYDESLRELETAHRLNPLSSGILTALAWTYIGKKDYQKAIEFCDKATQLNPADDSAYSYKAMALMKLGRYGEATETVKKSSAAGETSELGVIYALDGRTTEAREMLKRMEKNPDASPYNLAVIYGALGEKDRAFELLEKQLKTNSVDLLSIRLDPLLDSLRDDKRFAEIERKLRLP